jgi:GT2 family glycosyltransferase
MIHGSTVVTFLLDSRGTSHEALTRTLATVAGQRTPSWRCVLLTDGDVVDVARRAIDESGAVEGQMTTVEVHGGAARALNVGLASATGDFVAVVDPGDLLAPGVVGALVRERTADLVYCDEATIDDLGLLRDRFLKPAWSPERLRGQDYLRRLVAYRRELVLQVEGFDENLVSAYEHDLSLKVGEVARAVVHLPEVMYVRCAGPVTIGAAPDLGDVVDSETWLEGQRVVEAHMRRLRLDCEVSLGSVPGTFAIRRKLDPRTRVSIVIPTRGSAGLIWGERRCYVVEAVRSVLAHTSHQALEVVVVYDTATPWQVLQELREVAGDKLVLTEYTTPFNFSEKCNVGYLASSGDVVVMLNDDVEALSDNFVEQLVAPLEESSVGMTGARLLFPDDTIQHAGHTYLRGIMDHPCMGTPNGVPGPHGLLTINRETSGLTAACVAVRRETFEAVGGFSEALPVNFNDVDFSLKVRSLGLRNVWLAGVTLYHFESRTRERTTQPWEPALVYGRWDIQGDDRYMPGVD